MSWSESFAAHLAKRGISQLDAVCELRALGVRATQSQAHYWCRGSVPRVATRQQIEAWSGGDVPSVPHEESSLSLEADPEDDDSGTLPTAVAAPPKSAATG